MLTRGSICLNIVKDVSVYLNMTIEDTLLYLDTCWSGCVARIPIVLLDNLLIFDFLLCFTDVYNF